MLNEHLGKRAPRRGSLGRRETIEGDIAGKVRTASPRYLHDRGAIAGIVANGSEQSQGDVTACDSSA